MIDFTPDYENALLSQIFTKPSLIEEHLITTDLFEDKDNRTFFEAMQAARNKGLKPDLVSISDELNRAGHVELITKIAEIRPTSTANATFYVEELRERQRKNAIAHFLLEAQEALKQGTPSTEMIDKLFQEGTRALQNNADDSGDIVKIVENYELELQDKINERKSEKLVEILTGIRSLDALSGAIQPGEMVIVAARPSVGKTALATQIAMYNAQRDLPCAYFSLEMTQNEIIDRILAQCNAAPLRDLRNGFVDLERIHDPLVAIGELPLAIFDGRHDLGLLRARLRREKAINNLQIAFVDYLGLLDISMTGKIPSWQQVSEISRNLKILAMELKIVLFLVVQLNRDAEGKVPTLADLRDSGALEQDADKVILLSRPNDNSETRKIHLAKNRHGRTGRIEMRFDGENVCFEELSLSAATLKEKSTWT